MGKGRVIWFVTVALLAVIMLAIGLSVAADRRQWRAFTSGEPFALRTAVHVGDDRIVRGGFTGRCALAADSRVFVEDATEFYVVVRSADAGIVVAGPVRTCDADDAVVLSRQELLAAASREKTVVVTHAYGEGVERIVRSFRETGDRKHPAAAR